MHGPQKKRYLWAYLLSTRWAKAPSCEAKPRPWTVFRKKYHKAWVKIRKQFLLEVLLLYQSPAHPHSLLCQKLTAITYCSFMSPPSVWNLSQQISVQHFRGDKRDDCVWAFPLYPADRTKLSLEKRNYSHVKKNILGIVPGGQTKGYSSCSGKDHATPFTAERWAHINISTGEPAVQCKLVHWCFRELWGERSMKTRGKSWRWRVLVGAYCCMFT